MKAIGIILALTLVLTSCGADEDNGPDLADHSGVFALTETFNMVQGNGCSEPAVKIFENQVTIGIEKSDFEAVFAERWATLYGAIDEDTSFLGAKIQIDRRFEFLGIYSDLDNLAGIIKDIDGPCTRIYDVVGVRSLP